MKTTQIVTLACVLIFSFSMDPLFAKRAEPAKIKPIENSGNVITESFDSTEEGFVLSLVAKMKDDDTVVWRTNLYQRKYSPSLEKDVQDIFLKSLKKRKDNVVAVDERGTTYKVELATGALVSPQKAIVYPKLIQ
ncbi:MAG: hypothetical protein AB7O96_08715 [Pseudobdellovibrionaceae bacterium]